MQPVSDHAAQGVVSRWCDQRAGGDWTAWAAAVRAWSVRGSGRPGPLQMGRRRRKVRRWASSPFPLHSARCSSPRRLSAAKRECASQLSLIL